jgi:hypothetical protein
MWTYNTDEKRYMSFMHSKAKENFLSFVQKEIKI